MANVIGLSNADLLKDETIIAETYGSWMRELRSIILFILLIAASIAVIIYSTTLQNAGNTLLALYALAGILFLIALVIFIGSLERHFSKRYFLTNFRIVKRSGVLSKKIDYVMYNKIQDVKLDKTAGERLLGIGDIFIDVAGTPKIEMVMWGISNPEKYNKIILERINESQNRGV
jgi:uncharacterized membrane protein YdbT with pleckstrin-like domain